MPKYSCGSTSNWGHLSFLTGLVQSLTLSLGYSQSKMIWFSILQSPTIFFFLFATPALSTLKLMTHGAMSWEMRLSHYITGSNSSAWTIMITLFPISMGECPALSLKQLFCCVLSVLDINSSSTSESSLNEYYCRWVLQKWNQEKWKKNTDHKSSNVPTISSQLEMIKIDDSNTLISLHSFLVRCILNKVRPREVLQAGGKVLDLANLTKRKR